MSCTTPVCFSIFIDVLWSLLFVAFLMIHTLVEIFKFFVHLFVNYFYYDWLTHASRIKKIDMATYAPAINYHLKSEASITHTSLPALLNPLHCSTKQELFEKHLCNQNSHYEKYGRFPLRREAITCYHRIDTFRCQQR